MGRLVLGLDLGITSVGYGIIDIDDNQFVDYGVRLFKEGTAANNADRRTKRGGRRLKSRKKTRLSDMSYLLKRNGIQTETYIPYNNPYELRVKGLSEKLTMDELTSVILHITKNRGSCLDTVEDNEDAQDESEKAKEVLGHNGALLKQGKYVCEIQLERLINDKKVRGHQNNFKTVDYVKELEEILSHQDLSKELVEQIISLIQRKRAYYEGPGSQKSPTPYGRFNYVNGELVEIDLIEKMRGKCSVYPDEFRAPKMSYSADLFNLLNDLNNLTIENEKITTDYKKEIISIINEKGSITPKQLAKLLGVDESHITGYRIDTNKKPLLTEFKGYKKILSIFKKNDALAFLDNKNNVDEIIEILTKLKGISERANTIHKMFPDYSQELINDIASVSGISGYHSFSLKAIYEFNTELLNSSMNQMQLLYQLDLFDKNRKSTKGQKKIYADDEAVLSPVAKRAQRETFKVINGLREKYGEFDSIIIETTRAKNSQDQKKTIADSQKFFATLNKNVEEVLKGEGFDPASSQYNAKLKEKIRLYLDQDGKSAYTARPINLYELIHDETYCEVDHIIPRSISLDDSYSNKALITRLENQEKGNLTPIDAYLKGKFSGCTLEEFKQIVMHNKKYTKAKRDNLLYEMDITKYSNAKEFINRNLVDTSYTNRVVLNTLTHYFKDNNIDTKVHTVKGKFTGFLRKKIHMQKDRDENYLHHAIDALIVASIKKMPVVNKYLSYSIDEHEILFDTETAEVINLEVRDQYDSEIYIQFISNLRNIFNESSKYYQGILKKDMMNYNPIKISHKIDTKPNRQVADETIYSTREYQGESMVVAKYKDIYDPKFKYLTEDIINNTYQDKYLMAIHDEKTFAIIKSIIMDHYQTYKNDENYYKNDKKGIKLIGENPLTVFKNENGCIRKYSKNGNGPEIIMMKYLDEKLRSHIDISQNYNAHNKKVVLKQVSPYRTDIYQSSVTGKYNMVTIRYKDVRCSKSKEKYIINNQWYNDQKISKKIDESFEFICSLHHDELIGIVKKDQQPLIYQPFSDKVLFHDGVSVELLKFTATNDDEHNVIEVKPIYTYCSKQLRPSIPSLVSLEKYATDELGNLYKVKNNVLKLEF